ncbi:MAG TPA: LuxR C-terminal-related transcriptional regulator [Ornithinicoccus sp.]|nr:LuxR C-terminal-related transcriptional regulator [Ornithinicoccus sp.]
MDEQSDTDRLTTRQVQILRLVRAGLTNRQIARTLGISEGTVRKHLENVHGRLGVHSRVAAVYAAFTSPADAGAAVL